VVVVVVMSMMIKMMTMAVTARNDASHYQKLRTGTRKVKDKCVLHLEQ
jgi:hypothetical protein